MSESRDYAAELDAIRSEIYRVQDRAVELARTEDEAVRLSKPVAGLVEKAHAIRADWSRDVTDHR